MPALIGKYDYSLDPKNRMFVPPRYREYLAQEKGAFFILAKGLDQCLYLYLPSEWNRLASEDRDIFKLADKDKQRLVKTFIFTSAREVAPDEQGRILIPAEHKEYAALAREVVVAGMGTKAEIWDKRAHDKREQASVSVVRRMKGSIDL